MADGTDLERAWADERNWTGKAYRCTADPRMVVPKRNPALGWTFNWAHPQARTWFGLLLFVSLTPSLVLLAGLAAFGVHDTTLVAEMAIGAVVASVGGSLVVTALARRVR